jgi:hypothetical protein
VFRNRNIFKHKTPPKLPFLMMSRRRDTHLKKTALAVAVSVFAVLMVLPVVRSVNLTAGKPVTIDHVLYADGWPMPPLPPKPPSMLEGTLVADGWPMPPLPPKPPSMDAGTLVADGWPMPPLPPELPQTVMMA